MSLYNTIYNNSPVFIQNLIVSIYGYYWKQRRMGGNFKQECIESKQREKFTKEQWVNYQNKQLKKLLSHANENVPYYQSLFKENNLSVEQLAQINIHNLGNVPVLSKENFRKFGTTTLLSKVCEPNGEFFSSSGSTGTPIQVLISHAMHQRWIALFETRVRNWAGVSRSDSRGMIGGRRVLPKAYSKPPFYRYNYFEKQVYFSAYHINAENAKNYVDAINQYDLQYMNGYAMSNFFLARFIKEQKLSVKKLKAVITSSEKLTPEMRQLFSEVYGCKAFDGWSGVEACGLVTECEEGSLHISPDAGIIELLDDNLNPVKVGEAGNVYCTGLLNYDQPLIRYAIGDSMILSEKKCNCGREMPVIQEIIGRIEDVVYGEGGREMVRFHGIFVGLKSVKKAQIIQEKLGEIIVKVEPFGSKIFVDELGIMKARIISQLGNVHVFFEEVSEIPLTANGKFKAVVSNVKRENL